jgi:hypothetical protein
VRYRQEVSRFATSPNALQTSAISVRPADDQTITAVTDQAVGQDVVRRKPVHVGIQPSQPLRGPLKPCVQPCPTSLAQEVVRFSFTPDFSQVTRLTPSIRNRLTVSPDLRLQISTWLKPVENEIGIRTRNADNPTVLQSHPCLSGAVRDDVVGTKCPGTARLFRNSCEGDASVVQRTELSLRIISEADHLTVSAG